MTKTIIAMAAIACVAAGAPAFAGTCPAGKAGENPLANAATMPSAVTDTVIGAVDLGPYINVPNRSLRLRRLVIQPGGVVPLHSHADRPAVIMVASGEVTEYSSTCTVPIVHRAGETIPEEKTVSHWWKNTGRTVAILYSSDVHNDAK
ncbi:hypothetical protein PbB2_01461 [Candidatus Phycosocius bacilliformis]|uniref:Cupin type-2 domain-containing protein n=1 Tax=Candidatus Phycosocius bacilliformis TaxID=1445552 RepID=A0A2P2E9P6_9PROT|nr:cupin domain-containing protein [Candidatus Phycosocius bacilliformis]GBF57791.1 hypothetical protein PbB2_01461 [Candidatus Phycosocius bacilliformis]